MTTTIRIKEGKTPSETKLSFTYRYSSFRLKVTQLTEELYFDRRIAAWLAGKQWRISLGFRGSSWHERALLLLLQAITRLLSKNWRRVVLQKEAVPQKICLNQGIQGDLKFGKSAIWGCQTVHLAKTWKKIPFWQDNALFDSKAKINVFQKNFKCKVPKCDPKWRKNSKKCWF